MQNLTLSRADRLAVHRELSRRSLGEFMKLAWPVLEPGQPYVHGWHMDAIADHLQAIATGEITRLLINIPPGTSKSTAVSVFFPAWLWGPHGSPSTRIIGASYEQSLATRDNRRNRILVESDWYQERWKVPLVSDQNEKTGFENEARGWRQSCAVKSMTGKRGDVVIWDDPLSPEKAYSDTERETANRVFAETLPTRLNNPDRSAIVIVMQRLHENDVSGYILSRELGYDHLMLPMEFEADRKCRTSIGFEDPRTKEGELLFPDRFPAEVVERDKKVMGSFATAGQFQQRPAPRGGGMFKRSHFNTIPAKPAGYRWVRGWDLAATEDDDAARTAGVLMGKGPDGRICIAHVVKEQTNSAGVERLLRSTAMADGREIKGSIPQDPGSAGKSWANHLLSSALMGFSYEATPETGDKETRAMPLAAQVEAGNVDLVEGDWVEEFLDEITTFPAGKWKDQVDAATRAFDALTSGSTYTLRGIF